MHQFWENMVIFGNILKSLHGAEKGIGVTDIDKYLFYSPGTNLDFGIKVNDPIKEGSLAHQVLQSQKRIVTKIDKKLFGVAYIGIGTPIIIDGNIVGTLLYAEPTIVQDTIVEESEKLDSALGIISQTSSGLSAASQQLANTATSLSSQSQDISANIQKTDIVLNFIMELASETKLLGVNALIEAAKAGSQGKRFNVVAEEIRDLAYRTKGSVDEIIEIINEIRSSVKVLVEQIFQIAAVSEEQSASVEETTATIQEIASMSRKLRDIAAELTH